jgi:hypothetical protein
VNLLSKITTNPVDASVSVESDNDETFNLLKKSPGVYALSGIALDDTRKYRLHITTKDNKEYRSDFVPVKNAPPIDSIGFNVTSTGIQLYSNAHDPTDNTRYYRFDYAETWQFHSMYGSANKTNGIAIGFRLVADQIYFCFQSHISSNVLLASTAKLSKDALFQSPILTIPSTSEKIETKYSIFLRQHALTAEAYKFWQSIQKNTEQLGSIFDAQPTQLSGNIHNVRDDSDIVIGYVSAGSVSTKRVFISKEQLPVTFITTYPYGCSLDSFWYDNPHTHKNDVERVLVPGLELVNVSFYAKGIQGPAGYTGADKQCIDCTSRGTTKQPDFWK